MDQDLVSQFKHKYETLAGIVHIAETEDAAAEVVLQILKEARSKRVALGPGGFICRKKPG
jgi:L-lactate utilization protein LutB